MPLNLDAIGSVGEPVERSWNSKDALLYAVAVGAGTDPLTELEFTTENSRDVTQRALPTMGVVLAMSGGGTGRSMGSFNPAMLVHAEQGIEFHRTLEPEGTIRITSTLKDIVDKGSGALVISTTNAVDAATGEPVFTTHSGAFIRGEGGFAPKEGGEKAAASTAPAIPDRPADEVVTYPTLLHQALLYRLCGDRNPLHSDPSFATLAGFDRPILHGLCTYGFTGRALLHSLCASDPTKMRSMFGRFTRPVFPGQNLTVSVWRDADGNGASFRTTIDDGTIVIDRGRCTFG
jgi:acyl dehydratase